MAEDVWCGYFQALRCHYSAREPDKIAALEARTGLTYAEAVLRLMESSEPTDAGSQRKLVLRLRGGAFAQFRPLQRRMHPRVGERLDRVGVQLEVAPYWLRLLKDAGRALTTEGFRSLYEEVIGDPRREVAAWRLTAALGSALIVPAGLTTVGGEVGSVQVFVDLASRGAAVPVSARQLEQEQEEANLLDYLLNCVDRPDNWELTADGHLLLVDNTQVFGAPGKYGRSVRLTSHRWRRSLIERLRANACHFNVGLFEGLLDSAAIEHLRRRLRNAVEYVDSVLNDLTPSEALVEG
jgi:hypothetical protein